MNGAHVIEMDGVSFSYDGHPVLVDVDLTVDERDFVTIVGPNGGGKTTLLRLVLGLVRPTKGRVRVFGIRPVQARPRIAYTPQHSLVDPRFPMRVLEVVLMGRLRSDFPLGGYTPADREAAIEALHQVELADLASRPFSSLSGGQRQRTLIARALASRPDLLLLDEPTSNLDAAMEQDLHTVLETLSERMTVVLVSHDLGFVSGFAKTVVCVKQRVVSHPTCEITGDIIREMYGEDVRMVLHDLHDDREAQR